MTETIDTPDPIDQQAGGVVIVSLAMLPARAMMDEKGLSSHLGVSTRTIERMVASHQLPPPFRLAKKSWWFAGRILEHFEAAAAKAAEEAAREAERLQA